MNQVEEAVAALQAGEMIVVSDDEDRENEGDLIMLAEKATTEAINFLITEGRGLVCVALTTEQAGRLQLPLMVARHNTEHMGTAFTVSVDYKDSTTGISAAERGMTVRALADPASSSEDFLRPGHVFPLIAREGGVLARAGHTEAAVDLAHLAGARPAGVICEIMNADGTMARGDELAAFAARHGLKRLTVAQLIAYRNERETVVRREAETVLPNKYGTFRMAGYSAKYSKEEAIALIYGDINGAIPLVRVHSECLTGDVFGSFRCDCGEQLETAMAQIAAAGSGVIVYLRQEGRGIGLLNKLKAYQLQDQGLDTVEANEALGFKADLRDYGFGAQILRDLGLNKIRLLTNNPRKIIGLKGHGLEVVAREPLQMAAKTMNQRYLLTKKMKLGHMLNEGA